MHVLVTGGRSDVARGTVELLLARGHRVSWAGPAFRPAAGGTFSHLAKRDSPWRNVDFRGIDGLIHLRGPHPAQHLGDTDLRRASEFDRALFARAAAAGIERALTLGVVSNPRVQDLPFVRAKRETEARLADSGIPATVFRVPWLYGPNDDFLTRLWRWVRHRSVLPGLAQAPVQLCSERVLAEAIVAAIERPPQQLRIYEAATTTPIPLSDLIVQLGLIVRGEPPRTVPVTRKAFHLRGPLRLVGLIPIRSPMWALLEGGLTCATTAFERDFDVPVQSANRALIDFVRQMGQTVPWWGRNLTLSSSS